MSTLDKSLAIRLGLYSIDPEEFDRIFVEEWERTEPETYREFADYLNWAKVLQPTGKAKRWTRYSTNNHVRRLARSGIHLRMGGDQRLWMEIDGKKVEIPATWS